MARLAALVTVVLWASAFVGIRAAGEDLSPGALSLGRLVLARKPLLSRMSGLSMTWFACSIGAAVCLPFALQLFDELGSADGSSVAWLIFLGVFPTSIGFMTWASALSRTSAGRMGATTYLVPPIAILIAWAMLDETPPELALLGGALCLVGVAIARR